jgi:hypothetical protein
MPSRITERWTTRSGIRIRHLGDNPAEESGRPLGFVPGLTDFADDYLALLEFFIPRRTLVAHGDPEGTPVDAAAMDRYRSAVPGVAIAAVRGAVHDLFCPDRLAYPRVVEAFLRGDFA